jgi:bacteriorhodopsin
VSQLSVNQFYLVLNVYSLAIGILGLASLFFLRMSTYVTPKFCIPVTLTGLIPLVALYNYVRLYDSWSAAYVVVDGVAKATGTGYNPTFRYSDWLITVPLNLVVLVLVMDLPPRQARIRAAVLACQGVETILLGYPGLVATETSTRWIWWCVAMVPFSIIMQQLFFGLAQGFRNQDSGSRALLVSARTVVLVVWSAYPIIYLLPLIGLTGSTVFVTSQVAYALADITAKGLYGLFIFLVAMRKSQPAPDAAALPA